MLADHNYLFIIINGIIIYLIKYVLSKEVCETHCKILASYPIYDCTKYMIRSLDIYVKFK